ncbi:hypothetical protein T492DRAFT_488133 [Pavlovales sp. CCMP2436]|nr:hypothetical protein T492DRAFT_488133 [Pavlovales sp. CCMP2436]
MLESSHRRQFITTLLLQVNPPLIIYKESGPGIGLPDSRVVNPVNTVSVIIPSSSSQNVSPSPKQITLLVLPTSTNATQTNDNNNNNRLFTITMIIGYFLEGPTPVLDLPVSMLIRGGRHTQYIYIYIYMYAYRASGRWRKQLLRTTVSPEKSELPDSRVAAGSPGVSGSPEVREAASRGEGVTVFVAISKVGDASDSVGAGQLRSISTLGVLEKDRLQAGSVQTLQMALVGDRSAANLEPSVKTVTIKPAVKRIPTEPGLDGRFSLWAEAGVANAWRMRWGLAQLAASVVLSAALSSPPGNELSQEANLLPARMLATFWPGERGTAPVPREPAAALGAGRQADP